MALNVVQYEEVVALLRQVPNLVDMLESRHSGFCAAVLAWLKQTEAVMEANRLPAVSQIASNRATLIEATRGVHSNELNFVGRPSVRKIREATATLALERANGTLQEVIAERQAIFQEAERITRQVVAVASAKGLIQACDDGRAHPAFLSCLQHQVSTDPDLASLYAHLVALVGKTDVLIFIDRALPTIA